MRRPDPPLLMVSLGQQQHFGADEAGDGDPRPDQHPPGEGVVGVRQHPAHRFHPAPFLTGDIERIPGRGAGPSSRLQHGVPDGWS